jgi:hypothetical protein
VEENFRKGQDKWSFRHTGVYHHHTSDFDLFILLHPNSNGILESRLLSMLGTESSSTAESSQLAQFRKDPYRLHLLVMSSFFDNWRWYFRDLGEDFRAEVRQRSLSFDSVNLLIKIEQSGNGNKARCRRRPRQLPESSKFAQYE